MKRLLTLFVVLLAFLAATAQVEHSIILDQSTFRPVQDDPLSGVNIDPIAKDASRNACARVKIKFANMSRAEVDALAVKFLSNTDLVRQYVAEYFDNVLILEMTAKPNTRFYVVSPDFGESNEVCLNLEGNKVYQMMARLNQLYSIVVSSNMPDVEVYLDDCYQGNTDKNNQLSIHDVIPGSHRLKLKIGNDVAEQNIVVHRGSIAFKVDINLAAPTQSYSIVVMSNMPDVEVFVDGNYKGITDSNNQLSIPDVASGTHQLKLKFGTTAAEHTIAVHRNSIFFKQDLQLSPFDRPASSSSASTPDVSEKRYKVGDYYNENGKEGVVFEVSADGRHGKIVSMNQSPEKLQWCSDNKERKRLIGASSETDGAKNMAVVKAIQGWESMYPAFKWCADLGEGWYLPAMNELSGLNSQEVIDAVKRTIKAKGGQEYGSGNLWKVNKWYWASTECNRYKKSHSAWGGGGIYSTLSKSSNLYVRAVSAF